MHSVTYIGLAHMEKTKRTFGPTQYYMLEGEKCYGKKIEETNEACLNRVIREDLTRK